MRFLVALLAPACSTLVMAQQAGDFDAVASAFREAQAKRRDYTGTIRAKLTVFSPSGGSETFPEMVRRIRSIEGGVCRQSALWSDGKPVYEKEEVAKRCADLTSEFSGFEMDQLLALSGYRADPASTSRKRRYSRTGVPGRTCLESVDVVIETAPGALHPSMIRAAGGAACAANVRGLFRDASVVEARYAPVDGVWQLTSLLETHRAPFESYDVMTEVEFFFRTFKSRKRLREPMIRIEKAFADYRHIERVRKLVANPVEGSLKEDSEVSIQFDLENEVKPGPVEPARKSVEDTSKSRPK